MLSERLFPGKKKRGAGLKRGEQRREKKEGRTSTICCKGYGPCDLSTRESSFSLERKKKGGPLLTIMLLAPVTENLGLFRGKGEFFTLMQEEEISKIRVTLGRPRESLINSREGCSRGDGGSEKRYLFLNAKRNPS